MNLDLSLDTIEKDSNNESIGVKGAGANIIGETFDFTGVRMSDDGETVISLTSENGDWPLNTLRNSVDTSGKKVLAVLKEQAEEAGNNKLKSLKLTVVKELHAKTSNGQNKLLITAYKMYNGFKLNDDGQATTDPFMPMIANATESYQKDWNKINAFPKKQRDAFWKAFYAGGTVPGGDTMFRYNYKVELASSMNDAV